MCCETIKLINPSCCRKEGRKGNFIIKPVNYTHRGKKLFNSYRSPQPARRCESFRYYHSIQAMTTI
jgi:hypothetical protein